MKKNIYILGISAFYHDSTACLLRNGEILYAAQEERFTRKKDDFSFPPKRHRFLHKDGLVYLQMIWIKPSFMTNLLLNLNNFYWLFT